MALPTSDTFTILPTAQPLTEGVGSPLWWIYRLSHQLSLETIGYVSRTPDNVLVTKPGLAKLDRYYDGNHDLPFVRDPEVRAEFLAMLERSQSNFMRLVVNAAAERLGVLGLRLPGDDEIADTETWAIWTANNMETWAPVAFRTALTQRRAFWSVWWGEKAGGPAKIALEDPQQVIVEYAPADRTLRAAGLKKWVDDWTGETFANLAIHGQPIYRYKWSKHPSGYGPEGWYERAEPVRNPLGVVPFVPMVNQPDIHLTGVSELDDLIAIQDRINQTLFNRQVAEHLSAFRQKWATGLEIPVDDDGEPIETYQAAIDRIWISPEPQSRFGQFEATELKNYHTTIEQDLEHLSVISRTPRHVFMHQGQAPSGDAMKSDEAGLVAKIKGLHASCGPAFKEVLRLARQVQGMETPADSEVVWADPEFQTLGQLVDAQIKLLSARVSSLDYAREKIGMSPSTIVRVKAEILQDGLMAELLTPTPEPVPDADTVV